MKMERKLKHFHKKNIYFIDCSQEKKWVRKAYKAHKREFKSKTIEKCVKKCPKDICLLRKHINENYLTIFYQCDMWYCPDHEIIRNFCRDCGTNFGDNGFHHHQPLCGDFWCENTFNKKEYPFHKKFVFGTCVKENRCVKKSYKAHKRKFNTKTRRKTIEKCIENCREDTCLLRKHINNNNFTILYNDTKHCEEKYCPEHEIFKTFCQECGIDLGEWGFHRQLCGKFECENYEMCGNIWCENTSKEYPFTKDLYFDNYSQENKFVKRSYKAHKQKFNTKTYRKTVEKCIENCREDTCLLRKHIKFCYKYN